MEKIQGLPIESLRKIKKTLNSCRTVDQVTSVRNWVANLKLSKEYSANKALYEAVENDCRVLANYLNQQKAQ